MVARRHASDTRDFVLDEGDLQRIRRHFVARIQQGLAGAGDEVAALAAWLGAPRAGTRGQALVVDLGGTQLRAAWVELDAEGGSRLLAGPLEGAVPGVSRPVAAQAFFDAQASLVAQLGAPDGLPLGYCFSYPARILPNGDAELLRWTKEVQVPGVEGRRVGSALRRALRARGVRVDEIRVLNDTVAALMACGQESGRSQRRPIGLIVGTGTNMASFFPVRCLAARVLAAQRGWAGEALMAVNLESGNLHPPCLCAADEALDAASSNPGAQRMEKAVSGRYLPRLLALASGEDLSAAQRSAELLSILRRDEPASARGCLANAILDRSADLVAVGLAAVADLHPPEAALSVGAEGSLFWRSPGYAARVQLRLDELLGAQRARIRSVSQANLVGAAAAALEPQPALVEVS